MITIYNRKLKHKIEIDDSLDWVQVNPKTYEDRPHFRIELGNGFQFLDHATKCKDCNAFRVGLASNSVDWFVHFEGKKYLIITDSVGSKIYGKNHLEDRNSFDFYGSIIQLELLPLKEKELENERILSERAEDYEKAEYCRDMILELKNIDYIYDK